MKKWVLVFIALLMAVCAYGQSIKFEFSNIQFRTGRASIDPKTYPALDSLAEFLKNSGAKIEIAGHTDNVGGVKANLRLSQQRAESVKNYLVSRKRIPSPQLTAKGYGDMFPLVPNLTSEYRAKNRRVEITILSKIRTARLSYIQGNVFTRKQGITNWQSAVLGQILTIQDEIVTDSTGRAEVTFDNGAKLKLLPKSNIVITKQSWDDGGASGETEIKLTVGRALSKISKLSNTKERFSLVTPTAVAGIRGTEFIVEQKSDKTALLSVWENMVSWRGQIASSSENIVSSGKGSRCRREQQPEPPVDLPAPPFPKSPAMNDTFFYNPDHSRPIVFKWTKPSDIKAHFLVWQDTEQNEVLADVVIDADSFKIMPPKTENLYWQLTAIDSIGFEGQPWPNRKITLVRKLDNPKLDVISPKADQKISRNSILITGQTDPQTVIIINERPVSVSVAGNFSEPVKLSPGINNIMISATDRAGNNTAAVFSVVSSPYKNYEIQPFAAGIKLFGGDCDDSEIGFLVGMKAGFNLNEKYGFGIIGGYSQIGATNFGTTAPGYNTELKLAGIWGKYTFAPSSAITPYLMAEAGAYMWKNLYNDVAIYESNSPYIELGPGVRFNLYPGISMQIEGKGGYLVNNDPISGPVDINNLLLTGSLGFCLGF
jgi:hypothetical protein